MKERQEPFVVSGTWPGWSVDVTLGLFIIFAAAAVIFGYRAVSGGPRTVEPAVAAGGCVVAAGFFKWLHGLARRRSWRVEFHSEQLLFIGATSQWTRVAVPWGDIAWFSDPESECVQIKLKGLVSGLIDLQVPTPTEADRVDVLSLLASHGITRRD